MNAALAVITATIAGVLLLGLRARHGRTASSSGRSAAEASALSWSSY
jgi:hypothetical protein